MISFATLKLLNKFLLFHFETFGLVIISMYKNKLFHAILLFALFLSAGCVKKETLSELPVATGEQRYTTSYRIAPGDILTIFIWRNPEISTEVVVRPDGFLSAPLIGEVPVSGKTAEEISKDVTEVLKEYLKDPIVSVIVKNFNGTYKEQVRVLGEATNPMRMLYRDAMTLMDVMISVGGLTRFADGDNAVLIRKEDGVEKQYRIRLNALLKKGDAEANIDMKPGDIIIIPEAWF